MENYEVLAQIGKGKYKNLLKKKEISEAFQK